MFLDFHKKELSRKPNVRQIKYLSIITLFLSLLLASTSFALIDLTIFGPKRYDRLKGKPTVYTDIFERCNPADQAILRVTNGDSKKTRIKSARIYVNGVKVASEHDFKHKMPSFDKVIAIKEQNELKVVLKSGRHDYFEKLAAYQKEQAEAEARLAELRSLREKISSASSAGEIDHFLETVRDITKRHDDHESHLDRIGKSLDDDADDDGDSSPDDEPEIDTSWLGKHREELERSRSDIKEAIRECNTISDSLDRAPPKKQDDDREHRKHALTELVKLLKELDAAIAKTIDRLSEIAAKIEKIKKQGPSFLIIEIIGKGCDSTPPVISNPQPADGSLLNIAGPVISAQYADDVKGTGIDSSTARITVDGKDVTSSASIADTGLSYTPSALPEGNHAVTVAVSDKAKNPTSFSWHFTTDTIAPVVKITSHQNNEYLNTPTVVISGTLDDPTASVTVNGKAAQVTGNTFTLSGQALTEGQNTITVEAQDPAKNIGKDSIAVNLDTAAPTVIITAPQADAYLNTPAITVTGTVNEPVTSVTVNGTAAAISGTSFSLAGVMLAEGANSILVEAKDRADNPGSKNITVNLDTVTPAVTITEPVNGLLTNNPQVTVSGSISELNTTVTVNGSAAPVSGSTFSLALTLSEGENTITAAAQDRATNSGTGSIKVVLDSIAPAAPVLTQPATPTSSKTITVTGTAEAGAGVQLIVAHGGVSAPAGSATADGQGNFTIANVALVEGTNDITATATDAAKNTSLPSASLSVVLDTAPPAVQITAPQQGAYSNTPQVAVSGTVNEPVASVTVNGVPATISGTGFSLPGVQLTEGQNTITIEAKDLAGNQGTSTVQVTIDTIAPVIQVASPVQNSFVNTPKITVSGGITELHLAEVTVNGTQVPFASNSFSLSDCALAEGSNTITITAKDLANNQSTTTVALTLDSVAPTVTIAAPLSGYLTNNAQVSVSGTVSEQDTVVKVNTSTAQVTGQTWSLAAYGLSEGQNTINATATDRAGNSGAASITVTLDSIAPAAPIITQPASPTNNQNITVSGTAEAGASIKIYLASGQGTASLIGTATADGQGSFTLPNVTLTEGGNSITATATDTAGNTGASSTAVTVLLDTKAPVITVLAPENNSFSLTQDITLSGTLDEAATLLINGAAATVNNNVFSHPVTLSAGANTITLSATDPAGNTSSVPWTVNLDQTPPVVTITAPVNGSIVTTPSITVTGTANKQLVSATINSSPANVSGSTFSLANVALAEGGNTITVEAFDRAGNKGTASVNITLDTIAPLVSLQAPAQAAAGASVSLSLSASDAIGLKAVEVTANNLSLWSFTPNSELSTQNSISYLLSPDLAPGTVVNLQARVKDSAGNAGTATAQIQINQGPSGHGFIQGEVYDDSKGLRLEGAQISITAISNPPSVPPYQGGIWGVTLADGGYFTEAPEGDYLITISKAGFTSVERLVTVKPEKKTIAVDARLTPVNTAQNYIDANGGIISAGSGTANAEPGTLNFELTIPANTLDQQFDLRLTRVSNQGLAHLLPSGWSPIAAVDVHAITPNLELKTPNFASPAALKVTLASNPTVSASTAVTIVSYDATSHQWLVQTPGMVSSDGLSIHASPASAGQYAFILPDEVACSATVGVALAQCGGNTNSELVTQSTLTATGRVVPPVAPPSAGLKAVGELVLGLNSSSGSNGLNGSLSSGLIVNATVTEKFDLLSGNSVVPTDYVQDLVLYRSPCLTNLAEGATLNSELRTLNSGKVGSTFPVTPSKEYTIVDLMLGKIGLSITLPEPEASGTLVGTSGGRLLDSDGTVISIPANALTKTVPIQTKTLPPATLTGVVGADFTLLRAVSVSITGATLSTTAELSIPVPSEFNPSLPVVIAKAIDVKGASKLKLVALAKLSGSLITSLATGPLILAPGIISSGQYFFLQAKSQLGFVQGTVTAISGSPAPSVQVTSSTCSLVDLTGTDGKYLIAATVSPVVVTATDIYKYDSGYGDGTLSSANQVAIVNLSIKATPPSVISLLPGDGAIKVEPKVSPVITFSEPLDKTTVTNANITLTDASGNNVSGVFSSNPEGKVVTFYPGVALKSEGRYTLAISMGIRDLQGYPLAQAVSATFTVKDTTPPPMPPAGSIVASFPDADGFVTITATQGSAEATGTVLIINDTSGEIVSVKPATNGSFTGKITAQLGDEIKLVSMDASGNQTLITYITFKSSDGRYLVTAKGGIVEGEGGLKLEIPEGALLGPTVLKITPVPESGLPRDNPVPSQAKFLAAVNIDTGGIGFQKEVKVSVPKPSNMPDDAVPFIAQPAVHTNADGTQEKVYVIHDSAKVIDTADGKRLTTASPPFDGVYGFGIFTFLYTPAPLNGPVVISGYAYRDMDGAGGYLPGTDLPVKGAVIRSAAAYNFISYSGEDGHYAAYGFSAADVCRSFATTAIHPQTMNKVTANITTCDVPYIVNNFNFKLADKNTQIPDKTSPSISMNLQVALGQGPDAKFVAGTVPVNTEIETPISIIDQEMGTASLIVSYKTPDMNANLNYSVTLVQSGSTIHTYISPENPVAIYKYTYAPGFGFPIAGSQASTFKPGNPGTYTFTLEATDAAGNKSSRTMSVRAVQPGTQPDGIDGPPQVDEIIPADGAKEIMVTMPVMATFNEPVKIETVNSSTFKLMDLGPVDLATGATNSAYVPVQVAAAITTTLEGGRVRATLTPASNLMFGRQYQLIITQGITDAVDNPSVCPAGQTPPAEGCLLALNKEYKTVFTTKNPQVYDLDAGQFTGGRDIALYTDANSGKTYAYVTAGSEGYRIIDVTDPTQPSVVKEMKMTNAGVNWIYRNVAVDQDASLMAMTEDIEYSDGNQYGYVRFYDLTNNPQAVPPVGPAAPVLVGKEKLAEAFSGIPGRLALSNGFAYIATVGVGLQVVDIQAARQYSGSADGSTIVGIFDTLGQGFRQPTDVVAYRSGRLALTTTGGYLLLLDTGMPQLPQLLNAFKQTPGPNNYNFDSAWRVAVAPDYAYTDQTSSASSAGSSVNKVIDLAVTASMQGRIHTVDITDPYNPAVMGVTKDTNGSEVIVSASDITISKGSGLVYITAGNSVYIIDIKDPNNPKLLNIVTQTPDAPGSTIITSLGASMALVEKDGWVYLANQNKGLRVLDLDPVYLRQYCDDAEFSNLSRAFCTDYYPALEWKTITLEGRDTDWKLLDAPVKVRLKNLPGNGIQVRPLGTTTACSAADTCKATFEKGYAKFQIKAPVNIADAKFAIDFQIDPTSLPALAQQLYWQFYGLESAYSSVKVWQWVRNNSKVTFGEVLNGEAVFVYDDNGDASRIGPYRDQTLDAQDEQKRFYFVQELLNQVVLRKRTLADPFSDIVGAQYSYNLMDENGRYDAYTYNRLIVFKDNFKLGVNDKVGPYGTVASPSYSTDPQTDNTSDIFRKLMKDYGKRQKASSWLIDGAPGDSWLHKIIDKNTLVGKEQKDTDAIINGNVIPGASQTAQDTGLYELYKNIVERFVNRMIDRGEHYAGMRGVAGQDAPTDNWVSRVTSNTATGLGAGQHGQYAGMSYSYGGIDSIELFNSSVSGRQAPAVGTTPANYRGNASQLVSALVDTTTLADSHRWAGMKADATEYNQWSHETLTPSQNTGYIWTTASCGAAFPQQVAEHPYYPAHWAGIDCAAFVQRIINESDPDIDTAITDLPGIWIDVDSLAFDLNTYRGRFSCATNQAGQKEINMPRSWVGYYFENAEARTRYVALPPEQEGERVRKLRLLHKGDLIQYPSSRDISHVSMVYSDRSTCVNSSASCAYEIIHAYGGATYKYDGRHDEFSRKVTVTRQDIGTPTGFGRIKLWD